MATTTRWKYHVVTVKAGAGGLCTGRGVSAERLQSELDQQGMLGWELVQIIHRHAFSQLVFKRPM